MNGFLKDITYARSGEYILSIYTRESCKDIWKNFGERPITFTITKKADPRGLRANSYAWALIEQLAARLKTDKESVYEEMIRRYGVKVFRPARPKKQISTRRRRSLDRLLRLLRPQSRAGR